jgi:hypothetical protein
MFTRGRNNVLTAGSLRHKNLIVVTLAACFVWTRIRQVPTKDLYLIHTFAL